MQKVLFYCQYHLGMGHLVRSVEIMHSLATEFQVCFVKGGTDVAGLALPDNIEVVTLPTLLSENRQIKVADPSQDLETVKQKRTEKLLQVYETFQPDCLIIEGYPFKKYQFEFEAIPLLERVKAARKPVKVICSLRDVVMAQPYRDRNQVIATACARLNQYFDVLLVHSDPRFHHLADSFPAIAEIHCPIHHTGFVAQSPPEPATWTAEDRADFSRAQPMISVSVGGGQLGHELLEAVITAGASLRQHLPRYHLQVFTGPFMPAEKLLTLQQQAAAQPNLTLRQFTPNLLAYMQKADLSLSLGGYNTTMNILRTGVNAMILPSRKDWEQAVRAEKLQEMGVLRLLQPEDLQPESLVNRMVQALETPCSPPSYPAFELHGAQKTTVLLQSVLGQFAVAT
jgi:predicted glycosyltransferase